MKVTYDPAVDVLRIVSAMWLLNSAMRTNAA